jgi:hypothetical protein
MGQRYGREVSMFKRWTGAIRKLCQRETLSMDQIRKYGEICMYERCCNRDKEPNSMCIGYVCTRKHLI